MADPKADLPQFSSRPHDAPMLPDEENALEDQLDRVRYEKKLALKDPGPGWGVWFYYHASKWYIIFGFLIVLGWEVAYLFPPTSTPVAVIAPLAAATMYAEFLAYSYLYHRPSSAVSRSTGGTFRRTPWRPVQYGRWTPEGADVRAGRAVQVPEQGVDPREFI